MNTIMQGIEFLEEADGLKICDKGIKNKWRFEWLREVDGQGISIGTWCKKINQVGHCFCIVCNTPLNYGSNGKKVLFKHSKQSNHQNFMRAQKFTQTLAGAKPLIASASIADRVADQKAAVTAFLSEKMLPFSLAPDIVELSKFLTKDKSALSKLRFSRTSATYINTHGTAKCLKDDLSSKLKDNFFSLNIDEGTTNAMDKIINIFVRFFDDSQNMVVTDHLGSRKSNISTSKNIFDHVNDVLMERGLDCNQIVSCLLDNCNTMRGCQGGVEKLIRNKNPNLLDIHGDTVHIVHNSAKTFFNHFDGYMEGISSDLYYDIQDSAKAKELFSEIQTLLNYDNVLNVIRFIDNRFVQLFSVCERLYKLNDALKAFYFAFLPPERKEFEMHVMDEIYVQRKISPEQQKLIKEAQDFLSKQKLTSASAERKARIVSTFFRKKNRYFFLLQFHRGILMQFANYIKQFQHEKPMIHVMHEEMYSLCRKFMSFFIKPEFLPKNVKDMLECKYESSKLQYEDKFLNLGKFVLKEMLDSQDRVWAVKFLTNLRDAYINTTKYLLSRLPLRNKTLARFSALNPCLRKKSTTLKAFHKLAESLPQIVCDKSLLLEEIREYTIDKKIDDLEELCVFSESQKDSRIDLHWWSHVFNIQDQGTLKYPLLSQFVKAILTPFSGPLVEGSFNIMGDIITQDRTVLTVENYEAISTIKYHLRRKKIKAIELEPSPNMRKAIHTAYASYQQHLLKKKNRKK